jgi:hypothetical protein
MLIYLYGPGISAILLAVPGYVVYMLGKYVAPPLVDKILRKLGPRFTKKLLLCLALSLPLIEMHGPSSLIMSHFSLTLTFSLKWATETAVWAWFRSSIFVDSLVGGSEYIFQRMLNVCVFTHSKLTYILVLYQLLTLVWVNDFAPFISAILALVEILVSLMMAYYPITVIIATWVMYLVTQRKRQLLRKYYRRNRPWGAGKVGVEGLRFALTFGAVIMALDIIALSFMYVVHWLSPVLSKRIYFRVWDVFERRCLLA